MHPRGSWRFAQAIWAQKSPDRCLVGWPQVRVLVIDPPAFTPPYDHALCEALAARGHDVELVTAHFTHGEAPRPAGYRRRRTFGPPLSGLVAARPRSRLRVPLKLAGHGAGLVALAARAARTRPDIVHWQWAPLPRLDTHAIRLVGARAGATVITAHDVLPRRSASEVALWRGLYRHCERVIAHSEASRTRLLSEVGLEPGRVALVPHGLFTAAGPPVSPTRTGTRLLFFGLIRPDKGLDLLIEALPAVLRAVPDAGLRVVGSPRMPLEPLREQAAALGVAGAIEWDLRFVPDGEIAGVFAAASVVVLPYRAIEGSGVLATALALGVPPVATAVGSFPELLAAYDLGPAVPADDPAGLAAAIVRALTDEAARAKAYAGMERARDELGWERVAELTEQAYDEAMQVRRRRGGSP